MNIKVISIRPNELPRQSDFEPYRDKMSVLVQVVAATQHLDHLQNVLNSIAVLLPQAVVIGASSDEAIEQNQLRSADCIVLSIIGFDQTALTMAFDEHPQNSDAVGRGLMNQVLHPDSVLAITFCDAASINGEHYLDAISRVAPELTIAGGVASTATFTDTYVIAGTKILSRGAVMVSLNSKYLSVYRDHSFGWQPVGQEFVVTKAKDNRVDAISEQSPMALFRHYLGDNVADALPGTGSAFPLMIVHDGELIARGIIGIDGESFIVSGNVSEGDSIYIGYGNPNTIVEKNRLATRLKEKFANPEVILSYYCEGRKLFLPRVVVDYEVSHLGALGPTAGFFTLGEFYTNYSSGSHQFLNFNSTIIALKESSPNVLSNVHKDIEIPAPDIFELVAEGLFNFIDVRTEELSRLAFQDELTGLPNRNFFKNGLNDALNKARIYEQKLAVLLINLDHFKEVNDTAGHSIGDKLLQQVADNLAIVLGRKAEHIFARFDGGTFILLLENRGKGQEIEAVVADIFEQFEKPIEVNFRQFHLTVSIGISRYPDDADDAESLIKYADVAISDSERRGQNSFQFFQIKMLQRLEQRKETEDGLRNALIREELAIYYQPKVDINSGLIIGAEALIRWIHPQKGLILPTEFISVAEDVGLLDPIGDWVLASACRQTKEWINKYQLDLRMGVNLSVSQFEKKSLVQDVMKLVDQIALLPKFLELEITESMIMSDADQVLLNCKRLNETGVALSLDDFGTGYSSLAYLKQLPITSLKIDRSFVQDLADSLEDEAIVSAIISMGHSLGLTVIAEGVESEAQLNKLKELNCDEIQGFYFSPPLPAEEFAQLLEQQCQSRL